MNCSLTSSGESFPLHVSKQPETESLTSAYRNASSSFLPVHSFNAGYQVYDTGNMESVVKDILAPHIQHTASDDRPIVVMTCGIAGMTLLYQPEFRC